MNETGKAVLAAGAGVLVGKFGGTAAWWALGALTALFVLNSPATQTALKSVVKR